MALLFSKEAQRALSVIDKTARTQRGVKEKTPAGTDVIVPCLLGSDKGGGALRERLLCHGGRSSRQIPVPLAPADFYLQMETNLNISASIWCV